MKYLNAEAQLPQGRLDLVDPVALVMLGAQDKTTAVARQIRRLVKAGWRLYATGGTARFLAKRKIPAIDVAEMIGHGPAMDHRMASCSWETNSALISDQNNTDHRTYLALELQVVPFQLLICTVYGLHDEMLNPESTWKSRLELTDFGGPAAIRAAAKGRRAIVWRTDQLKPTIGRLLKKQVTPEWLEEIAAGAEQFIAHYCGLSAANISGGALQTLCLKKVRGLRRGENPYQTGAMLMRNSFGHNDPLAIDCFEIVGDTEPGWVNYTDVDRALNTLTTLAAVMEIHGYQGRLFRFGVVVKHGNPVGLTMATTEEEALKLTLTGNQRAAFGGILMVNFILTKELAKQILHNWLPDGEKFRYLVGIVAPGMTLDAIDVLRGKGVKKQLLINPALEHLGLSSLDTSPVYRPVRGGTLVRNGERYLLDLKDKRLTIFNNHLPVNDTNLLIAWAACATSDSNTTSCAKDHQLVGNGVGQQDRVGGCQIAMEQAGERAYRSSVVTDSFFPKLDGPKLLVEHGVSTVMSTMGSNADDEVVDYFREHGVVHYTIPDVDGRVFSGH